MEVACGTDTRSTANDHDDAVTVELELFAAGETRDSGLVRSEREIWGMKAVRRARDGAAVIHTSTMKGLLVVGFIFLFFVTLAKLTSDLPGSFEEGNAKFRGTVGSVPVSRRTFIEAAHRNDSYVCSAPFSLLSSKIGKMGRLNDDYCDCEEGSFPETTDELATSACSNALVGKKTFFCGLPIEEQHGIRHDVARKRSISAYRYWPRMIFASRVGDGVCDCCGGEDEAGNPHLPHPCPNVCEHSIEHVPAVYSINGRRIRQRSQKQQVVSGATSKYYDVKNDRHGQAFKHKRSRFHRNF